MTAGFVVPSEPLTLKDSLDQDLEKRYGKATKNRETNTTNMSWESHNDTANSGWNDARAGSPPRSPAPVSLPLPPPPPTAGRRRPSYSRSPNNRHQGSHSRSDYRHGSPARKLSRSPVPYRRPPSPRRRDDYEPRRRASPRRSPSPRSSGYHRGGPSRYSSGRRSPSPRSGGSSYRSRPRPGDDQFARRSTKENRTLGVFALSRHVTKDEIHHHFERYGPIANIVLIARQDSFKAPFAFVTFEDIRDAITARNSLNATDFMGSAIRVDYSMTNGPHAPTPGMYHGRRTNHTGGDRHYSRRYRSRSRSPRRRPYSPSRSPPRRPRHSDHRYDRY
ncbi:transformer 2 beta [Dimargaris verticillata]|uniref:Transformer 2 beta n=1 Tax=Dimargaris verticillata TaxID=2761393 RepID=A0A9W8B0B0_9FUNG|nr:transformer 2 beta [Dimargaris verticillata]